MCVALPGRVVEVDGQRALLDLAGVARRVSISLLLVEGAPVETGDWVLADAGMAVRRLTEREALDLLETLGG